MFHLFDNTDSLAVNTIRTLSMDAIQKANSGHPGLPMGAAPMAYALWSRVLNTNLKIHIGLTGIVLYFLLDTAQCFYIVYYI